MVLPVAHVTHVCVGDDVGPLSEGAVSVGLRRATTSVRALRVVKQLHLGWRDAEGAHVVLDGGREVEGLAGSGQTVLVLVVVVMKSDRTGSGKHVAGRRGGVAFLRALLHGMCVVFSSSSLQREVALAVLGFAVPLHPVEAEDRVDRAPVSGRLERRLEFLKRF